MTSKFCTKIFFSGVFIVIFWEVAHQMLELSSSCWEEGDVPSVPSLAFVNFGMFSFLGESSIQLSELKDCVEFD